MFVRRYMTALAVIAAANFFPILASADEYRVDSWESAVAIVQSRAPAATIFLDFAEDECDPQMVIEGISGLKLIGRGPRQTSVHIKRDTSDCIRIADNVSNIQITNFSLLGAIGKANAPSNGDALAEHQEANRPGPKNPGEGCDRLVHRGISTAEWICRLDAPDVSDYAENVSQIYIADMEIAFLTTGISIQGPTTHPISGVDIRRNRIHHIRGTGSGVGYGIQTSWTPGLLVYQNELFRVGRHSIYVGLGGLREEDRILVQGNSVVDGGFDGSGAIQQACIAIARTAFVTVRDNTVRRCYAHAMSVERDEGNRIIVKGIVLQDNKFFDTPPGRIEIWVSLDNHSPSGAVRATANTLDSGMPARLLGTLEPFVIGN